MNALDGTAHLKEIIKWDGINGYRNAWNIKSNEERRRKEKRALRKIISHCIAMKHNTIVKHTIDNTAGVQKRGIQYVRVKYKTLKVFSVLVLAATATFVWNNF